MEQMECYSVTTRRYTLRCGHEERLKITQDYYNEVLLFYYGLFLRTEEREPGRLLNQSNQQVLRELEMMTVVGRDKSPVPCPLPWKSIPLYFRRAAINAAIGEARSYLGRRSALVASAPTERFQRGVTFYKGMYRDLTDLSISLRLWDGKVWSWVHCRLKGRELPADARWMSPTLQLTPDVAFLHIPVRVNVEDGRKAKERMKTGTRICSLQFTNGDAFAVGVVLGLSGDQMAVRFFRGGSEYTHLCRTRLDRIRKSVEDMGLKEYKGYQRNGLSENLTGGMPDTPCQEGEKGTDSARHTDEEKPVGTIEEMSFLESPAGSGIERYNQKYWRKLKHLNDYYAHLVSREIVDFCKENQAGMIVVPGYDDKFAGYVMTRSGNWSVLKLSRRIISLLSYKAWQSGIVVVEVHAGGTSSCCSMCGEKVRKHGAEFECPQGHCGNRYLNTARNLGMKCLRGFGKTI